MSFIYLHFYQSSVIVMSSYFFVDRSMSHRVTRQHLLFYDLATTSILIHYVWPTKIIIQAIKQQNSLFYIMLQLPF